MLDIDSDRTQQYAYFVGHIEILEVEKLAASRRKVGEAKRRSRPSSCGQTSRTKLQEALGSMGIGPNPLLVLFRIAVLPFRRPRCIVGSLSGL